MSGTQRLRLLNVDGKRAPFAGCGIDAKLLNDYVDLKKKLAGGLQQIGEPAEHARADGLALIGARHAADLVGRDAEMIGPEPDQPLDKPDLVAKRSRDANARFFQVNWASRIGDGLSGHLLRHLARLRRGAFHHGGRLGHLFALSILFFFGDDRLGLPLRIGIGHGAKGLGT